MRLAAKVDRNDSAITDALIKCGCSVLDLTRIGGGAPDKLIGIAGIDILAEIKDGTAIPSKRQLNALQKKFHSEWRGRPIVVLYSVEQALDLVAFIRGRLRRPRGTF